MSFNLLRSEDATTVYAMGQLTSQVELGELFYELAQDRARVIVNNGHVGWDRDDIENAASRFLSRIGTAMGQSPAITVDQLLCDFFDRQDNV